MRKSTVYLITVYMTIGAFFNMAGILYLINVHAHDNVEIVLTMGLVNAGIIVVLRDIARFHEIKCHGRIHSVRKHNVGVTTRRS